MTEVIEEDEASPAVSERVQVLAQGIYDEFQSMVENYGPDCIGNLAPLVVNVLENFDSALGDNQVHLTALMEVNEENEQLSKQYNREKQRRREIEEKAMKLEDVSEQEMRDLRGEHSRAVLETRQLQAKMKAQKEHDDRMEERYEQLKREKKELHDRNIELIKNFHGQMEALKESAAIRIAEARRSAEDMAESPVGKTAPGFHDFTSPSKGSAKKKRQLPLAPRRKGRASSDADEDFLFGVTPSQRPDSPEYSAKGDHEQFPANTTSFHDEQAEGVAADSQDDELEMEEAAYLGQIADEFTPNEESLLAELHLATTGKNVLGVDEIITENEELQTAKSHLTQELDDMLVRLREVEHDKVASESVVSSLRAEKESLRNKLVELEGETKRLRRALEEEQEKATTTEATTVAGPDGLRLTRLEVARVLRERNEYKEKYLSLLEQVRMNDELYLFKKKEKKSKWLDYFTALFSPSKRRQLEQTLVHSTNRRPILGGHAADDTDGSLEEEGGHPQFGAAGYRMTRVIPTLRKQGKRQDELYMTSVSWVVPALDQLQVDEGSPPVQATSPNINTCRPMSYQEDGAKILCAAAINSATFLEDCKYSVSVYKGSDTNSSQKPDDCSMSLVWIITGVPNLTKVNILDAAAVGEVLETFIVSSSPIQCIAPIPAFNEQDPDVLASLSGVRRKQTPKDLHSDRPSSKHSTMWMGSDSGVLYVHSAVSMWKKCIHADKLPSAIQAITHLKGKAFLLLQNASLAVFRRFPDGEWDWDNYSIVVLSQRKDLPSSALAAVKFNVWCAIGNAIHVVHSHLLKMEATFTVHSRKNAEVTQMITIGDGVWMSFKNDSILRLFHSTTFTHMQDIDVAPSVHKMLVFGSEKRSQSMPVQVSTMTAAHSALWIGTENGITLSFPFNAPAAIAEESGWEVIKEAEVTGRQVPEPFDVRTEHAIEAGAYSPPGSLDSSSESKKLGGSGETPLPSTPQKLKTEAPDTKPYNPFCNVDEVQLSIHCHINAVKSLLSTPGMVPKDLAVYEPLGGVLIGSGDKSQRKPALFVVSCGEGHLDLRTADKVVQTIHAQEAGQSGLPTAASIISEKNYIMVWDIFS